MSNFSKYDSVLINGSPVIVQEFIAGGTQGEVYTALNLKKSEYEALKFLYGDYAPQKDKKVYYNRTVLLSNAKPLHPAFAWPSGVGVFDEQTQCFSYTMPLKRGFSASSKMIRYPQAYPTEVKVKVATKVLEAFCALEDAGLIYTDVSDKNILFKPTLGGEVEVAIIDCENITLESLTLGLQGTGLFRAPEVLLGASPTSSSIAHSLSVWVYRLLVAGTHPLNGSNQLNILFDEKACLEHYGKKPQFVFADNNNHPFPSASEAWNKLPTLMKYYFSYTFSDDVLKRKKSRMSIKYLYQCMKTAYRI